MWLGLGADSAAHKNNSLKNPSRNELTTLLFGEAVPETAFPCLQRGGGRLQALKNKLGFSILGLCLVLAGGLGSSSSLAPRPSRVLEEMLDL